MVRIIDPKGPADAGLFRFVRTTRFVFLPVGMSLFPWVCFGPFHSDIKIIHLTTDSSSSSPAPLEDLSLSKPDPAYDASGGPAPIETPAGTSTGTPIGVQDDSPPRQASISDLLEDMLSQWQEDRVSLGGLIDYLGDRGFGLIILVLALPNLIPVPIPAASLITGAPLIAFGYQMARGRKHPWLPKFLAKRSISHGDFTRVITRSRRILDRIESVIRPRYPRFVGAKAERLIGIISLFMALLVAIPLPFTNWFPALALLLFSIAIIQRDGLFALLGGGAAVCAVGFISTLTGVILEALSEILYYASQWF